MTTQELRQYTNKVLGNSIRCLLPSYWWKRLFGLVVDKVEEVENKVTALPTKKYVNDVVANVSITIDDTMNDSSTNPAQNKVVKEYVDSTVTPIVESEEELNNLTINKGRTASLLYKGEEEFSVLDIHSAGKRVLGVKILGLPIAPITDWLVFIAADNQNVGFKTKSSEVEQTIACYEGIDDSGNIIEEEIALFDSNGNIIQDGVDRVNEIFRTLKLYYYNYRLQDPAIIDSFIKCIGEVEKADLFIKGDSWERLLKKSELTNTQGKGAELLEIRYNWDGTELTDEDKAVNAATYAKVAAGGNYVFWSNCMGFIVYGSITELPYEEHASIMIMFESKFLRLMQINSTAVCIKESGDIDDEMTLSFGVSDAITLDFSNITTSAECFDYLRTILGNAQTTGLASENIYIVGPANTFGIAISFMLDTINNSFIVQYYTGQGICVIYATGYDDNIIFYIQNGGICYLGEDITDEYKLLNTYILNSPFSGIETEHNRTNLSAKFISDNTIYTPVSIKPIINNGVTAYQITIYRNNTFETWQINADGTSTLLT